MADIDFGSIILGAIDSVEEVWDIRWRWVIAIGNIEWYYKSEEANTDNSFDEQIAEHQKGLNINTEYKP